MSSSVSKIADHNVLDKRHKSPNSAVMRHVKLQRENLQNGYTAKHKHVSEMLNLHTQNVLSGEAIGPIFAISVALADYYFQQSAMVAVWCTITCLCYVIVSLIARSAHRLVLDDDNVSTWSLRFYGGYFLIGLAWASFFLLEHENIMSGDEFFFYSASLLILVAFVATSNFALPIAAICTIIPVLSVSVYHSIVDQTMIASAHLLLQIIAAGFFMLLGKKIYQSNLIRLDHQLEKDALIAELEVATALSEEARRRAEEANLAKSRFLASMSHELRTPLNAILGFSEIMKNGVMGKIEIPLYVEYTNDIHSSGQHLLNLINEILDLSRIEAGRYDLTEEAISLTDIAKDCIAMIQLKAHNKNIRLVEVFEENLPNVWADEKAIRQVALNLLSNAVKFTPHQGEIKVKIGWTAGGGQYMSIVDNGTGIAEEEIPVVLSAFGQGSIAIKSAEQGTGLGLPIVQAIMKKHDGNFSMKSKLRVGTTVTCIFPASRIMQSLSPTNSLAVNQPAETTRRRKITKVAS